MRYSDTVLSLRQSFPTVTARRNFLDDTIYLESIRAAHSVPRTAECSRFLVRKICNSTDSQDPPCWLYVFSPLVGNGLGDFWSKTTLSHCKRIGSNSAACTQQRGYPLCYGGGSKRVVDFHTDLSRATSSHTTRFYHVCAFFIELLATRSATYFFTKCFVTHISLEFASAN